MAPSLSLESRLKLILALCKSYTSVVVSVEKQQMFVEFKFQISLYQLKAFKIMLLKSRWERDIGPL